MKWKSLITGLFALACGSTFGQLSTSDQIEFIENLGQWDGNFHYKARVSGGEIYLHEQSFTLHLWDEEKLAGILSDMHFRRGSRFPSSDLTCHAIKISFENSLIPTLSPDLQKAPYHNFFLGSDSSRWKTSVRSYGKIKYSSLYNGIDLEVYSTESGNLKYDFWVAKGGDPSKIKIKYDGQHNLSLENGNLKIETAIGFSHGRK
jgi:hypothetical protein